MLDILLPSRRHHTPYRKGLALSRVAASMLIAWPFAVLGENSQLRCDVSYSGKAETLVFSPAADPYRVKAININDRFRFKAVVIGDASGIDDISLYVHDLDTGHPVLLHEANYAKPIPQRNAQPDALTGTQTIYSPRRGRELSYRCALLELEP
ncbi:hypothetical protein [Propionivibrio dicarboxylicus]|uniref:Uncharacterized protein n=1 Tax=Propionivibrio dicarboxylicus TaxID=83767 RepID=A0A1G7WK60_9RHOO|nr:hypothetical protein [Propionivibrio dicarboxylicus]SDG71580.1 hypothetical protein SAMN05660652_00526 [Propionivibrio dicarboxylicus]